MGYEDILYSAADGIARITLNKPEKLNAVSWGSWAEVESAIAAAEADEEVRAIVITGAGRAFCAGTDLTETRPESEWPRRPFAGRQAKYRSRYLATAQVYHCSKPTIAAVNGVAVGAGFSLALACDIRVASEAARFSAIFVKRAIVADTGMTWFLPRLIGPERALELIYTGRMVGAEEALRIGLVSEVVPAGRLEERVTELALSIARGPSLAIELDKRLVQEAHTRTLDDQIELEQFLQGITFNSADAEEGRRSFLEKREPRFKGM
jgi:2-(1,2-epoxy-1,2-dihydrophenyl)acetyl-CoA isomerase